MGKSLMDKIQAKLELFRLEKRYTRHRHRRSAFVSNAIYVDGEYVYQTPNSTGTSNTSSASDSSSNSRRIDALHGERASRNHMQSTPAIPEQEDDGDFDSRPAAPQHSQSVNVVPSTTERKKLHRFSSMPGFGGDFQSKASRVAERRLSFIR